MWFLAICKIGKALYFRNVIYTFCTQFAPHSMIIYPLHNFCCIPLLPAGLQQVGLCWCHKRCIYTHIKVRTYFIEIRKIITIDWRFMVGFRNRFLSNPSPAKKYYKDCQNPELGFIFSHNCKIYKHYTRISGNPSK